MSDIKFQFTAIGADTVHSALRNLERHADTVQKKMNAAFSGGKVGGGVTPGGTAGSGVGPKKYAQEYLTAMLSAEEKLKLARKAAAANYVAVMKEATRIQLRDSERMHLQSQARIMAGIRNQAVSDRQNILLSGLQSRQGAITGGASDRAGIRVDTARTLAGIASGALHRKYGVTMGHLRERGALAQQFLEGRLGTTNAAMISRGQSLSDIAVNRASALAGVHAGKITTSTDESLRLAAGRTNFAMQLASHRASLRGSGSPGGSGGGGRFGPNPVTGIGWMMKTGLGSALGAGGSFAGSVLGNVGRMASAGAGWGAAGLAGGAAIGGIMALSKGVQKARELQDIAVDIANQTRVPGQKAMDTNEVQKLLRDTSIGAGGAVSAVDVGAGAAEFLAKTGSVDLLKKFMPVIATTAAASGSDAKDIAALAGALADPKFGFLGENPSEMDLGKALATLTGQGRIGRMELQDWAGQMPKLAGAAKTFGLKGQEGIAQMGALVQAAMTVQGSSQQGTTSARNFLNAIQGKKASEVLVGWGVNPKDIKNEPKDFGEFFGDLSEALVFGTGPNKSKKKRQTLFSDLSEMNKVKDMSDEQLSEVMGMSGLGATFDERAMRQALPYLQKYLEALNGTTDEQKKSGEAQKIAKQAVVDYHKQFLVTGTEYNDLVGQAGEKANTLSSKLENIGNKLAKAAEDSGLLKSLTDLADAAIKAGPAITGFSEVLTGAIKSLTPFVNKVFSSPIAPTAAMPEEAKKKAEEYAQYAKENPWAARLNKFSAIAREYVNFDNPLAYNPITLPFMAGNALLDTFGGDKLDAQDALFTGDTDRFNAAWGQITAREGAQSSFFPRAGMMGGGGLGVGMNGAPAAPPDPTAAFFAPTQQQVLEQGQSVPPPDTKEFNQSLKDSAQLIRDLAAELNPLGQSIQSAVQQSAKE